MAMASPSRRTLLFTAGAVGLAGLLAHQRVGAAPATEPVLVAPDLQIRPRDAWGADLPTGPTTAEDSRFLLVHHSASPSNYRDARAVIRDGYRFQTGPEKGWPDVCYQFFIGRHGDVWEGRFGSLNGPVVADATGGSQGFAQLVCFLGDFTSSIPTDAALNALVMVLEWLARRDGIAVDPDATATFVSRGSQRWRAGTTVTTPTISGHRDMSYTVCPGGPLYALLSEIRAAVAARRDALAVPAPQPPHPDGLKPAVRLGRVTNP
jgi:N-acetylmuramoyl-L-alanine amidase